MDPDFPELTVHLVSQSERSDLVRDLNLSKVQPELLAPSLQGLNLLQHGVCKVIQSTPAFIVIIFAKDGV